MKVRYRPLELMTKHEFRISRGGRGLFENLVVEIEHEGRVGRGEVAAAFISCIYFGVAVAVVGSGLLADVFTLSIAVGTVAAVLALVAVATAFWHARDR